METAISQGVPIVLTGSQVESVPFKPLGDLEGVAHKLLWEDGTSTAGVLTVEAGHRLGSHAHHANHHHLWVLSGRGMILGVEVGPGGYVHIPAGVSHDIDCQSTDGCTVFYLYMRAAS